MAALTAPSTETVATGTPLGIWTVEYSASTGKDGRGILPVVNEPIGLPEAYGSDRLFVAYGDPSGLAALEARGDPIVRLAAHDLGDFGMRVPMNQRGVIIEKIEILIAIDIGDPATKAAPKTGDVWRGNFYRFNRTKGMPVEQLSWSPTLLPGFHQPIRFGFLEFGSSH